MGKDTRVTYRRRHAYATLSNRRKTVKTPGKICDAAKGKSKGAMGGQPPPPLVLSYILW